MNSIEFGLTCKPYNIKYRDLFGEIPSYDDYVCTQDEYLDALKTALDKKVEINNILKTRPFYRDPGILY